MDGQNINQQPSQPLTETTSATPQTSQPGSTSTPVTPQTPVEPATATPEPTPPAAEQTPSAASAQPPLPDPVMPATPTPVKPSPKGSMNPWMIISFVLLAVVLAGSVYMYMFAKNQPKEPTVMMYPKTTKTALSPTLAVSLTPSPSGTQSAANGTVSGTLCYPSSVIPAGTITAKSVVTGKELTQPYVGSQNSGGTTYTMPLPVDTYHLKFTPTQYSTIIGFYTDYSTCVGNPTGANCTGQKVRPLLPVAVTASTTVKDVNLCDYYYPTNTPPQF